MKCKRCKKNFKGKFRTYVFIENGQPKRKEICIDCFNEILKKVGETRNEEELHREKDRPKGEWQ